MAGCVAEKLDEFDWRELVVVVVGILVVVVIVVIGVALLEAGEEGLLSRSRVVFDWGGAALKCVEGIGVSGRWVNWVRH